MNLARDLAPLEAAIIRVQPELIVIDPITAYLGKTDSYKDAEVRALLVPLIAAAERHKHSWLFAGNVKLLPRRQQ